MLNFKPSTQTSTHSAKQFLRQIRHLDNTINAKLDQIEELKTMTMKFTSVLSNDKIQGTQIQDKMANLIAKYVDFEAEITADIDRLIDMKRLAVQLIDQLKECDFRLILTLRYLNYCSWEQIAVELSYTFQWVHVLHKRALIEFEKLLRAESSRNEKTSSGIDNN